MDISVLEAAGQRRRRKHSAELKAELVRACQQPGVSSAVIVLANGLNAKMLQGITRVDVLLQAEGELRQELRYSPALFDELTADEVEELMSRVAAGGEQPESMS